MEYFKYPLPKLGKEKRPYKIFKINISWKKKKKKIVINISGFKIEKRLNGSIETKFGY